MPDDVLANVARWLWIGLAFVAVDYAREWHKARKAGRLLPPHKHPGLSLVQAVEGLYRLWPMTLLFAVSWAMSGLAGMGRPWDLYEARQHLPATVPVLLQSHLLSPHWVVDRVLELTLRAGISEVGPLVLAVALGAGAWIAFANPWHLGRRFRIAGAFGALAVVFNLVAWRWTHYESAVDLGYWIAWAEAISTRILYDLVGALLVASLWHFGVNRSRDLAALAPKAYACFLVALVVSLIVQAPLWLLRLASAIGALDPISSRAVASFYSEWVWHVLLLVMVWAPWVAASTELGPISCISASLTLIARHSMDFLLLVGRVAVVAMPLHIFYAAEAAFRHAGAVTLLTGAISVTLAVWLIATTGLAYAAFIAEFPSAVAQAGEEAVPPNLPGDIPIAH